MAVLMIKCPRTGQDMSTGSAARPATDPPQSKSAPFSDRATAVHNFEK